MKTLKWTATALLSCSLLSGTALAQGTGARPGGLVRQTAAESEMNDYVVVADQPVASPSDKPATPPPPAATEEKAPVVNGNLPAANGEEPAAEEEAAGDEEWRLFRVPALEKHRINIHGWIDQGFTANPQSPANRFNGPVTFNDRSNEYMLNQVYLITEREVKTDGCGFDVGGRVDLLYGTDYRFNQAYGLETNWDQTERFYGLAMPQLFASIGYNDWTFQFGRFYTVVGYEVVTAPDNFFYSHAYTFQYGEPFTHTGMLAKYKLNDRLTVSGGFQRGWDQWEDINNSTGFLGGITWNSEDEKTSIAFGLVAGNEQPTGGSTRTMFSTVVSRKLGDKLKYVFEWDHGFEDNIADGGTGDATWDGLVNYLFYDLNDKWALGMRYEWFSDPDGVRVNGLGAPHGIPFTAFPANWNELSLGVNYKPHSNVLIRSEARWDWVDKLTATGGYPYDDFTRGSQFLWGNDLILKF
jgi:hypothetical protein